MIKLAYSMAKNIAVSLHVHLHTAHQGCKSCDMWHICTCQTQIPELLMTLYMHVPCKHTSIWC